MGLRERAVRGVAWSAVRNWGSRAVNLLVFIVLARLLAPEAFGLVALGTAYIALVRVFVDQGFADAIIQRKNLDDAHLDTAFWTNLGLSVAFTGGTLLAADPIARLFGEPDLAPVIQGLSPSFIIAALAGVQQALFQRALDYRTLAIRELVAAGVGGVIGVGMAIAGFGVWSLVGYLLGERTAALIVLWIASDWRPGLQVSGTHFNDLFSFGISIVGTNLLDYANSRADNVIIGYVLGAQALGFYEIAYQLLRNGTQLITQTVSSVAFSTFSRIQESPERMRSGFYTATRTISVVAFPLFLGAAAIAPELVEMVFGAQWVPLSAQTFQVLAFIGVLHSIFYFNSAVILAAGKPSWRFAINALNAVCNVVAFILVVQWGIIAVAAAYVVRGYVLAPVPLWAVRKLIGIEWTTYLRAYVAPAVATAAMAAAVLGVRWMLLDVLPPFGIVLVCVLLGALVYTGVLWSVAPKRLFQIVSLISDMLPTSLTGRGASSPDEQSADSPQQ